VQHLDGDFALDAIATAKGGGEALLDAVHLREMRR
jgi:hypothetical protein